MYVTSSIKEKAQGILHCHSSTEGAIGLEMQ